MSDLRASSDEDRTAGTGQEPVLLACDVSVYRRPETIGVTGSTSLAGLEVNCLDAAALTRGNLFDVRFDAVLAGLTRLDRADAEPDGFFVRTGMDGGREWRINGQLYELSDRLWRIDVRGTCSTIALDETLSLLGWPQVPVVFLIVRSGVTLAEEDFRRWAMKNPG